MKFKDLMLELENSLTNSKDIQKEATKAVDCLEKEINELKSKNYGDDVEIELEWTGNTSLY